jgi:hypothetical protein
MVRMWGIDERFMWRQHLLGEHVEMHMIAGSIMRGKSIKGYILNGLIETSRIQERHDYIADARVGRGYNHQSPLEYVDQLNQGWLDRDKNSGDLFERCHLCCHRFEEG